MLSLEKHLQYLICVEVWLDYLIREIMVEALAEVAELVLLAKAVMAEMVGVFSNLEIQASRRLLILELVAEVQVVTGEINLPDHLLLMEEMVAPAKLSCGF